MKIIIDAGIIFSVLLIPNSEIAEFILKTSKFIQFYSPDYLRFEIANHWKRIEKISKINDKELQSNYSKLCKNITFFSEDAISKSNLIKAIKLVIDKDIADLDYVSLTLELKGFFLTSDIKIYNHIKSKGFKNVINVEEFRQLRLNLKNK